MRERFGMEDGFTDLADDVWKHGESVKTPPFRTGWRRQKEGRVLVFDRYPDSKPRGDEYDTYCVTAWEAEDD